MFGGGDQISMWWVPHPFPKWAGLYIHTEDRMNDKTQGSKVERTWRGQAVTT